MDFTAIFNDLQPVLIEGLSVLVLAVMGWAANTLRVRYGLDIEERHRAVLHSALMNGVRAAISGGGYTAGRDAIIDTAIRYVRAQGAPVAAKRLGVSDDTLRTLALAKIEAVAQEALPGAEVAGG